MITNYKCQCACVWVRFRRLQTLARAHWSDWAVHQGGVSSTSSSDIFIRQTKFYQTNSFFFIKTLILSDKIFFVRQMSKFISWNFDKKHQQFQTLKNIRQILTCLTLRVRPFGQTLSDKKINIRKSWIFTDKHF